MTRNSTRTPGAETPHAGLRWARTTRVVGAILTTYVTQKVMWFGLGLGVGGVTFLLWLPDVLWGLLGSLLLLGTAAMFLALQLHENLVYAHTTQLPGGRPWHLAVGSVLFLLGIVIGPLVVWGQMGRSVLGSAGLLVGAIGVGLFGLLTAPWLLLVSMAMLGSVVSVALSPAVEAWLAALIRGDQPHAALVMTATGACALVLLGVRLWRMHEESPEWTSPLERGWGWRQREAGARHRRPALWGAAVTRWTNRRLDSGALLAATSYLSEVSLWRRARLWRLGAGVRQPWLFGPVLALVVGVFALLRPEGSALEPVMAEWGLRHQVLFPGLIALLWEMRRSCLEWESLHPVPRRQWLRELGVGFLLDVAEAWSAYLLSLGVFVGVCCAPEVRWAWGASFLVGSLWLQMLGCSLFLLLLSWCPPGVSLTIALPIPAGVPGREGWLRWGGCLFLCLLVWTLWLFASLTSQALERAMGLLGGTVVIAGVSIGLTWLAYRRWCGMELDM